MAGNMEKHRWTHGPTFRFFRDGKLVDEWAFSRPMSPEEALSWHRRHWGRIGADVAEGA